MPRAHPVKPAFHADLGRAPWESREHGGERTSRRGGYGGVTGRLGIGDNVRAGQLDGGVVVFGRA
jgi:hypothetical protein